MGMANHNAAIDYAEAVTGLRGQISKSYENQIYVKLPNRGRISANAVENMKRYFGRVEFDFDSQGNYYGRNTKQGRVVLHSDMRGSLTLRIFNQKFVATDPLYTEILARGPAQTLGVTVQTPAKPVVKPVSLNVDRNNIKDAYDLLKQFALIDLINMRSYDGVVDFAAPEHANTLKIRQNIRLALLGVSTKFEEYVDHHGYQYIWDYNAGRNRITLTQRHDGETRIGMCWFNV